MSSIDAYQGKFFYSIFFEFFDRHATTFKMETKKVVNRWKLFRTGNKNTANEVEASEYTCIVRLLDDTDRDPITVSYKVRCVAP